MRRKVKYKCPCDICRKWSPLHNRIRKKLTGRDLKLFEEFLDMEAQQSDDLGVAEAKLSGEWPGFEWMKKALKEHVLI